MNDESKTNSGDTRRITYHTISNIYHSRNSSAPAFSVILRASPASSTSFRPLHEIVRIANVKISKLSKSCDVWRLYKQIFINCVSRMPDTRMPKYLFKWKPTHGKRSRVRHRKNWMNCVLLYWPRTLQYFQESKTLYFNLRGWKSWWIIAGTIEVKKDDSTQEGVPRCRPLEWLQIRGPHQVKINKYCPFYNIELFPPRATVNESCWLQSIRATANGEC